LPSRRYSTSLVGIVKCKRGGKRPVRTHGGDERLEPDSLVSNLYDQGNIFVREWSGTGISGLGVVTAVAGDVKDIIALVLKQALL